MSLKIHSDKAWNIASHWSDVLASDTRTLAAAIDAALVEERKRALEFLSAKCEEEGEKLMERWHSDLGASDTTRAAGIASHIINDFYASAEVELMKMEKPEPLRATLADEGKRALEGAAKALETDGSNGLERRICCDGQMCGCHGSTVGEYAAHVVRSLMEKPE